MLHRARHRAAVALRPILPARARLALRRLDERVDPVHIAVHRRLRGEARPIPPRLLRERTGASTIDEYFATGARYAELVERLLERAGRQLATCRAVLDFGCGAGRTLQHLRETEGPELFGCDIHAPSVTWLRRNMPGVHVEASPFRPPLAFGDGRFDCIYAWSVFSHLDQTTQRQWLPELARILAPGGILLVSVFSEASQLAASLYAPSLDLASVEREGVVFVPYPQAPDGARQAEFIPTDEPYGLTFVSRDHARTEWSRSLDVVDIVPLALEGVQDVVVLRRAE